MELKSLLHRRNITDFRRCCDKIININTNTFTDYIDMKKAITYSVAALAFVGVAVLLFSTIGVAVFFLPLLAGAFK